MRNLLMTLRQLFRDVVLVALLASIIVACQKEAPTATNQQPLDKSVNGVIRDEQGYIVPNAVVEAINSATATLAVDTTDEYGAFTLDKLPQELSSLQLRVSHGDFKPFVGRLEDAVSNAGATTGLILHLLHSDSCCGRLSLRVSSSATGAALSGAEVRLRRNDRLVTLVTTDSTGMISFDNLCGGTYSLRISKSGYAVVERNAQIEHCDSTSLDIRLEGSNGGDHHDTCCAGTMRIIPRDSATNAVISGASVRITAANGVTRTGTTGGDGITFHEICAGEWSIRIAKDGYRVIEFSVTAHCNDSIVTTRTMAALAEHHDTCCDGRITVIARDSSNNELLLNATVKIWRGGTLLATRTVAQGGAVFTDLCAGEYSLDITREHYHHSEFMVTLGCNGNMEIVRRLLSETTNQDSCCGGIVTLIVRDSTSNAVISNATVRLWRGSTLVTTQTTNGDGNIRFTGLCTGTYGISIAREGYA
jgi:uncharacterized surface anchored protein